MDLEGIRTFVRVAQAGSLAAAARLRGVAPSSVSRAVAALEREVGIRLFQRTTRRLALTEAGRSYLHQVAPLLDGLERAGEAARDLGASPRGLLRIAVAAPFASLYLTRWLPVFAERFPDLQVELVLDSRYADLVGERIDVAVRLGRVDAASVIALKLCDTPRVVVASPAYLVGHRPRRPADVRDHRCLVFPRGGERETWRFRDAQERTTEVEVRPRVSVADGLIVRELAKAGLGLALLPRWLCAEELQRGDLEDVFPSHEVTATDFEASLWVAYPSRSHLPAKVRVFVDYLRELFREGPPWERRARSDGVSQLKRT
jgi:DNA-binding transcriptional LysR family regulator